MKTIYLLRHAKSDWADTSIRDFDRPLNKRGLNNAPAMGKLLKSKGMIPALVITSTAMRAKTTAELVTTEIGIKPQKLIYEKAVGESANMEATIVTNARHHEALQKIRESLLAIKSGMSFNLSGDLLTIDIRRALHYIGEITGQVEVDRDILGTIFGKFCIGK